MDDVFDEFASELPGADLSKGQAEGGGAGGAGGGPAAGGGDAAAGDDDDEADFCAVDDEPLPSEGGGNAADPAMGRLVFTGYLPGYGPPPDSPPPSYAEAMELKRRDRLVLPEPVSDMFAADDSSDEASHTAPAPRPDAAFLAGTTSLGPDEWELVVKEKKGYGVLVTPIHPKLEREDAEVIAEKLAEEINADTGRVIFLRRRKMAFITLKQKEDEENALKLGGVRVEKYGSFSFLSRAAVFGENHLHQATGKEGKKKQKTPPTGPLGSYASTRSAASRGEGSERPSRKSRYNGPPKRSVTPLSLSSSSDTTTDSDESSDRRRRRRERRKEKKRRKRGKKDKRDKKDKRGKQPKHDAAIGMLLGAAIGGSGGGARGGGPPGGFFPFGPQGVLHPPPGLGLPPGFMGVWPGGAPPLPGGPPPRRGGRDDAEVTFLIKGSEGRPPMCSRCREVLPEQVPPTCPSCRARLLPSKEKESDRRGSRRERSADRDSERNRERRDERNRDRDRDRDRDRNCDRDRDRDRRDGRGERDRRRR